MQSHARTIVLIICSVLCREKENELTELKNKNETEIKGLENELEGVRENLRYVIQPQYY